MEFQTQKRIFCPKCKQKRICRVKYNSGNPAWICGKCRTIVQYVGRVQLAKKETT